MKRPIMTSFVIALPTLVLNYALLNHYKLIPVGQSENNEPLTSLYAPRKSCKDQQHIWQDQIEKLQQQLAITKSRQTKQELFTLGTKNENIGASSYRVEDLIVEEKQLRQSVKQLEKRLNNALMNENNPEKLLQLAHQAKLLKPGTLKSKYTAKLLQSAQQLDEPGQEQMLLILQGSLQESDIDALIPFIYSANVAIQEEAFLRLAELEMNETVQIQLDYLAVNGHTDWVREKAEKQLISE
ncbi:MAG: hypothetical protein HRU20_18865 [Pseudomonadales bacterium]|nr:hypothetical protein [Pseudomonadales bacterium]